MRLLCIAYLYSGGDSEALEEKWRSKLETVIRQGDSRKRAAAVEAYAMGLFVCAEDADSMEAIELLTAEIVFEPKLSQGLLISALRGIALLTSSLGGNNVSDVVAPTIMDAMPVLLDHDNYEVQLAALQLVATVVSVVRKAESDQYGNTNFDPLDIYGYSEIRGELETLKTMQNKEIKQKVGKGGSVFSSKRVVSGYIGALEGDESGCSKAFGVGQLQFYVKGVAQMVQLDFFTAVLKEGTLSHARENPFFHDVFGWTVPDPTEITRKQGTEAKLDKAYTNACNAKARTKDRRRGQRKAADYQQ